MHNFSKKLSVVILAICVLMYVIGILNGGESLSLFMLSVSLAVAAIPEALPAVITVSLSRGAAHLSRRFALVRSLPAVESLGSVNYIFTDKTGTLTQNKMVMTDRRDCCAELVGAIEMTDLLFYLNNDCHFGENGKLIGEPTEIALFESVKDLNESGKPINDIIPRVGELPFNSKDRSMSTLHKVNDNYLLISKGAPEVIPGYLEDPNEKQRLLSQANELASEGKRVLGYAYKWLNEFSKDLRNQRADMKLGLVCGLMDPPRKEIKSVIEKCNRAGIKVLMVTGDHPSTARYIASETGILKGKEVVTNNEIKEWGNEDWLEQFDDYTVFARVSPEQKLQLINHVQGMGHFVAMTGDGVNDAPSLKAADIGVAMGVTGTDVSKEAADIVLLDDRFTTIVAAIEEGRRIYSNIRKFIRYILTCNLSEIWLILFSPVLGFPPPLLPIHLLWINLVTDGFPALALSNEKAEANIMKQSPHAKSENFFDKGTIRHIVVLSVLMGAITLFAMYFSMHNYGGHWQTVVFTTLAFSQLARVMSVRSERTFLFRQGLRENPALIISVLITFISQLVLIYSPYFNTIFRTKPLTWEELLFSIACAILVFHFAELDKWFRMRAADKQTGN